MTAEIDLAAVSSAILEITEKGSKLIVAATNVLRGL